MRSRRHGCRFNTSRMLVFPMQPLFLCFIPLASLFSSMPLLFLVTLLFISCQKEYQTYVEREEGGNMQVVSMASICYVRMTQLNSSRAMCELRYGECAKWHIRVRCSLIYSHVKFFFYESADGPARKYIFSYSSYHFTIFLRYLVFIHQFSNV